MTNDPDEKQPPVPPQADKPGDEAPKPAPPAAAKPAAPPAAKPPAAPPAAGAPAKPAAAAPPKAPAPPPPPKEGPLPLDNELVKRYKGQFGAAILESWVDRKQNILVVATDRLEEIGLYTRDEEKFDYLVDLTAVDFPKREKRFEVVFILYSFAKNEHLRLKVQLAENEPVSTVVRVWPTVNWLEREVFDMFGIVFAGHPNLKRLLLPEEWQGFPLRKDYDILKQDEAWIRENLGIESGQ
jgi:NADH-quinone oxidoreductase subunit C